MTMRLIAHEIYWRSSYGGRHPLAIPRVSVAVDLIKAMNWLSPQEYVTSPRATPAQLCRFHDEEYVSALQQAEARQQVSPEISVKFNFGRNGNPLFPEMYSRPAISCGGSILGAQLLLEGTAKRVFHPAGGTHHGRRDHASGFCYLNDPVLAILTLLDGGASRVAYVDFDAHHGDGVQDHFASDPRVRCLSIHQQDRWPRTGAVEQTNGGKDLNIPVPEGLNDQEFQFLIDECMKPSLSRFQAEFVVVQCGVDGLADDPMSDMMLANRSLWAAVMHVVESAPASLILGGGGYNPWSVARGWAGLWACLTDRNPAETLTAAAHQVLEGIVWQHRWGREPQSRWLTTIEDDIRHGAIRQSIRTLAGTVLWHQKQSQRLFHQ